jgi:hypothetical protein
MNITKRRTLLALVTVVVVLFGLTLSSCKDCKSDSRSKGKDPLGDESSADNSGNGSSTGSSDDGSVADNSSDESSADNSTSTSKNNPALPKEKRVLTQAEKNELDNLRGELVAAAKKINDSGKHVGKEIVYNSNIRKAGQIIITKYWDLKNAVKDDEIWLYWLANMYMCQIYWVRYLCDEFDADRIPAEDNNEDKKWAGTNKEHATAHEQEGKAAWRGGSMSLSDRNKLEGLLVPAQQEWDDLVAKENAYRDALRRFEVI